jgi:thiamine-monophosphate kinase
MPLPELLLIEKIRAMAGKTRSRNRTAVLSNIVHGIRDDCAVLVGSKTHDLLVTTDLSIEDIHFRLDWHPPASVGHRCLARGLSDIAAMGGEPTAAFLSLALPAHVPQEWVDGFFAGFHRLARRFGVPLAGGDIAAHPTGIAADIVIVGRVPRGKAVLRSGARPGDLIYVTGTLGRSAAMLAELRNQGPTKARIGRTSEAAATAHFFPTPRLKIGRWLERHRRATAMIDISDGLSTDLAHIAAESEVSARLFVGAIPFDRPRQPDSTGRHRPGAAARREKEEVARQLDFALHGGEDYELLFTASPKHKIPAAIVGTRVTMIGEIGRQKAGSPRLVIVDEGGGVRPFESGGWEHFSLTGDK